MCTGSNNDLYRTLARMTSIESLLRTLFGVSKNKSMILKRKSEIM